MKIILYLGAEAYLRHNAIITLPEESVELEFKRTEHAFGELVLTVKNARSEKQYKLRDHAPVDITEFCNIPGKVEACLSLTVRGEVARTWQIEPLCIRMIPGGFEAVPELEALKERILILEKAVAETASIIEN